MNQLEMATLGLMLSFPGRCPEPSTGASDWVSTGGDCSLFAAGDFDGDGFDDVFTVNGGRDMCIARSVRGWKAAPW